MVGTSDNAGCVPQVQASVSQDYGACLISGGSPHNQIHGLKCIILTRWLHSSQPGRRGKQVMLSGCIKSWLLFMGLLKILVIISAGAQTGKNLGSAHLRDRGGRAGEASPWSPTTDGPPMVPSWVQRPGFKSHLLFHTSCATLDK